MLHIKRLEEGVELFKALGSELRINILKLLLEYKEMNMNELASQSTALEKLVGEIKC